LGDIASREYLPSMIRVKERNNKEGKKKKRRKRRKRRENVRPTSSYQRSDPSCSMEPGKDWLRSGAVHALTHVTLTL